MKKIIYFLICISVIVIAAIITDIAHGELFGKNNSFEETENDITKLVVAIPFSGIPEEDLSMVEEKINVITREKINVELTFLRFGSYKNTVNLMLAGGEQLDIVMAYGTMFMEEYINDRILPLDDLLEQYGQGIIDQVGHEMIDACIINNQLYGIPNNRDYAAGTDAYMLREDILKKYGILPEKIQTIEDLEKVFETVKAGEPDMTILASGGDTMISNLYFTGLMMGCFRPGVHMNYGRDEELVNIFETEEYFNALKRMRSWYLKGYLEKDIISQTESLFTRVRRGEIFAYTTKGKPGIESQDSNAAGYEMVCVQLGENAISFNTISMIPYMIASNTISKEKSMELLNLLYTDEELMNLMSYGIEGVHYKKTEDGHFTYVDGKKENPFVNNAWKIPNQFISGVWEGNPLTLWEDMRTFNEKAIHSCDMGFNFDYSTVLTEYFTLKKIYSKYKVILENGLINPEEGLLRMNQEMEQNGIQDVLAEERRQYEKWKKRKSE